MRCLVNTYQDLINNLFSIADFTMNNPESVLLFNAQVFIRREKNFAQISILSGPLILMTEIAPPEAVAGAQIVSSLRIICLFLLTTKIISYYSLPIAARAYCIVRILRKFKILIGSSLRTE